MIKEDKRSKKGGKREREKKNRNTKEEAMKRDEKNALLGGAQILSAQNRIK